MKKKIFILGATGSIGTSTLNIVRKNPDRFTVVGIQANTDISAFTKVSTEFPTARAILTSTAGLPTLLEAISVSEADIVVNGIAGASGLLPSKATLESGKDLALANKETIVMAGPLIRSLAKKTGSHILPVDSEHSAVFSLINAFGAAHVSEIILTASGGPFRTWTTEQLALASPEDALRHPTWEMGDKITIDSASLANKGLEVIEACKLFDMPPEKVRVVVHPQSLVHSFIRTIDGVLYAQMSKPDMQQAIVSALDWPQVKKTGLETFDFSKAISLDFEPPRIKDFPLLMIAYQAASLCGLYSVAYNAANEIAVAAFLKKRIRFPDLAIITAQTLQEDWSAEPLDFQEILAADQNARVIAQKLVEKIDQC